MKFSYIFTAIIGFTIALPLVLLNEYHAIYYGIIISAIIIIAVATAFVILEYRLKINGLKKYSMLHKKIPDNCDIDSAVTIIKQWSISHDAALRFSIINKTLIKGAIKIKIANMFVHFKIIRDIGNIPSMGNFTYRFPKRKWLNFSVSKSNSFIRKLQNRSA